LDDPLSIHDFLLLIPGSPITSLPDYLMILFFFLLLTILSSLSRSSRLLKEEDKIIIGSRHGKKMLLHCLRQTERMESAFLVGKYIVLFLLTLLGYQILNAAFNGEQMWIVFFISLCSMSLLYFLSFLLSRMMMARSPLRLILSWSPLILLAYYLFLPFSWLYSLANSYFKEKTNTQHPVISMDDLSRALDLTENSQTNSEEHKLLKGIVTFGSMDITRIMKPKMDIIAFDFQTHYHELIRKILESGYSRIPVFRDHIDQIIGVLYIKDLLSHLEEADSFNWQGLLRPCFFIPENIKPDELLREFQHKKTHLAIVVDEFGQTAGLVTLEDIIEEIVGEINDEFDDDEIAYSKLDDQNYVFEGKTSMNDFLRIIGRSEESISELQSDADTLSGFIIERAGRFPKKNEKVNWENFTFIIELADSRRIKRVKVTIRKKAASYE
jgi:putative hemolysin